MGVSYMVSVLGVLINFYFAVILPNFFFFFPFLAVVLVFLTIKIYDLAFRMILMQGLWEASVSRYDLVQFCFFIITKI